MSLTNAFKSQSDGKENVTLPLLELGLMCFVPYEMHPLLESVFVFSHWCEILIISAPEISGQCSFVNSTKDSLTFTWNSTKSATSYRLVGQGVNETSSVNTITAENLQPGTRYTFTVWAVGESTELTSNNITCVDSTGKTYVWRLAKCMIIL